MPQVSVGLPVYNGENFIAEAIDSILNQSFEDLELVICDNASTDTTMEICQKYLSQDKRIQYHRHEKNFGAAYNYNRSFELASGEYFKWISHDDLCAPTFLERCVEVLDRETSCVLCYPKTAIIDEYGEILSYHEDKLDLSDSVPHKRLRKFLRKPAGCNPVFGLIRRDILATTQLIGAYESSDHNLLVELCLRGQFCEVPEYLFFRRNHPKMSRRVNKSSRDFALWFDPNYRGANRFPFLKLLLELIKCIQHSPISLREKCLCSGELIGAAFVLSYRAAIWSRARADQKRMY
ncbi:glycosyl transferase, family 2 [Candidatus Vecturithrix granuli]|uniref:Glycosyl transferase, family 2 n=1 Tax=Vecturithrix granuli TaxID=1499967 RepID=A0A081C2M3_VECG1|nr:glycosyl transferase, family 2 [Candidatus Vecturithrix granuli]